MEANSLGSGMFSGISGSGLLGLEMPLNQQQKSPLNNPQNQHPNIPTSQILAFGHHETDHHHTRSQQQCIKHGYPFSATKSKQTTASDEDESGLGADDNFGDKRKNSPWQRMKWTDSMVRLLIMAVFYIGDDGGSEATDKKKSSGGLLQKKGKWKSVSRAMMEKGFFVSPQQCEDKFNDLNKRFKRVNDILGKGTACRVVENQSLLDSMDLTPKRKEEVRKLLNSKHLFFREMCAYHNSCSHGNTVSRHSPEPIAEPSQNLPPQQQQQQRGCYHSSDDNNIPALANLGRQETDQGSKMVKAGSGGEDEDEEEDDEEDDDSEFEEEEEVNEGGSREEYENVEKGSRKRPRSKGGLFGSSQLIHQLNGEVMGVLQDGSRSNWEKKQWMKMRLLRLEEQQMNYQYEAFEIEKQRLKWIKFSSKKEREMERNKIENERRKLENERMVLIIRQKEFELQQQYQSCSSKKSGERSPITG